MEKKIRTLDDLKQEIDEIKEEVDGLENNALTKAINALLLIYDELLKEVEQK